MSCLFLTKAPFTSVEMSKFKDGRIHLRSSGMEGLNGNINQIYSDVLFAIGKVIKQNIQFMHTDCVSKQEL